MEDDVGPRAAISALEPAAVADVAEHVLDARQRLARRARGGRRSATASWASSTVTSAGRKPSSSVASARADRAAAAGDEHAPAAEQLLSSSTRGHRVAAAEHRLPVERLGRQAPRGRRGSGLGAAAASTRARSRGSPPSCPASAPGSGSLISATMYGNELAQPPRPPGRGRARRRRTAGPRRAAPCASETCATCACGPELLDVALELEARRPTRGRTATGRPRRTMRNSAAWEVSNVKPSSGHALAPVEQVAPVAADRGEEDAAGAHAQHGRDVLDQRRARRARRRRRRRSSRNASHRLLVERRRAARNSSGVERREEVDRQHGRADRRGELGAALDPGARLGVEAVDAHEARRSASATGASAVTRRPGRRAAAAHGLDRARERAVVGDVGRGSRQSSARATARRRGGRRSGQARARP